MTHDELRDRLNEMSDEEFKIFKEQFGGNRDRTRETVVTELGPKTEDRLCYLLRF